MNEINLKNNTQLYHRWDKISDVFSDSMSPIT